MSTQENELVKTEKDSCNSGGCSTTDAKAALDKAKELKNALEQKMHNEKSSGCCG